MPGVPHLCRSSGLGGRIASMWLPCNPEIGHDMSAVRRETFAMLLRSKEDVGLVEPAFAVFFAARMRVDL
jgi:hypothetical protein